MTEAQWDKLMKIRTSGRDDTHSDQFRFPYEPTPYPVLERLASSGHITKKNTLVDYGCGKGRVSFFLSWQTRCKSIGIEYEDRIFRALSENRENAVSGSRVEILHAKAETFDVPPDADRCYFFNPFSVEILRAVTGRIRSSWYEKPRRIEMIFYYPSNEYTSWLMSLDALVLSDEILCMDLFEGNDPREKILVFELPSFLL